MRLFVAALVSAVAVGCGSNGSVRVSLTDDPAQGSVKQLILTTYEVRIHDDGDSASGGGDAAAQADGATGAGWVVLCNDEQTFDLLQLRNGVMAGLCGGRTIDVAAGRVSQLRLGIKKAQLIMDNGVTQDLDVPSGATSG